MSIKRLFDRLKPDEGQRATAQVREFIRLYKQAGDYKRQETRRKIENRRTRCRMEAECKAALIYMLDKIDHDHESKV